MREAVAQGDTCLTVRHVSNGGNPPSDAVETVSSVSLDLLSFEEWQVLIAAVYAAGTPCQKAGYLKAMLDAGGHPPFFDIGYDFSSTSPTEEAE